MTTIDRRSHQSELCNLPPAVFSPSPDPALPTKLSEICGDYVQTEIHMGLGTVPPNEILERSQ